MTATTLIHGQPMRRMRAGEYHVTIGGRHYRIAGSPLTRQYAVTVDGQTEPVITEVGGAPFRSITAAARALEAHTAGADATHDTRFTEPWEQARLLHCELWADWVGSTVTGYVFTCSLIGCRTDTRTRHATPETALTAARDHDHHHQQQARRRAHPEPAPAGLDVTGIAQRARTHAEEKRAAGTTHPGLAAASAAVSVAVGLVFPPMDGPAYTAVLDLLRRLRDGGAGTDEARSQLDHHDYLPALRTAHGGRLHALAAVLELTRIDLLDGGRVVRELRACADVFMPEGGPGGAAPD